MNRLLIVPALGAALILSACGDDDGEPTTAEADNMSLTVIAPTDGTDVDLPFTVELESSETLGPVDDGVHHVHIWFGDDEENFELVESDTFEITDAPEGEHNMTASLRNADHTPAGPEVEITVNIGGASDTDDDNGPSY